MGEDPRLIRTRDALRHSLRVLLADHALDDISVTLICRHAQVHRTTFYSHAPSVGQFALGEFSRDIEQMATVPVRASAETPRHVAELYLASMKAILRHIAADRLVYAALFTSDSRGAFRSAVEAGLRPRAERALEVFASQGVTGVPTDGPARLEAAAFISGALVGAIGIWAISDDTDAAAASARIAALMPSWWPTDDGL